MRCAGQPGRARRIDPVGVGRVRPRGHDAVGREKDRAVECRELLALAPPGVAVVADEVRNLAGKSADAAHDTTVLIERAIAAVENGNNITNETAQAVAEVEARSGGVSDIVNKIAGASLEQTDMVKQVNIGVEQISNVVQTNSATAEESAAASEELSAQAQTLQKLVSQFSFKDEETPETDK